MQISINLLQAHRYSSGEIFQNRAERTVKTLFGDRVWDGVGYLKNCKLDTHDEVSDLTTIVKVIQPNDCQGPSLL